MRDPTGAGSSGFTNYTPSSKRLKAALEEVFSDYPDAIVVDGDDDWFKPYVVRPAEFAKALNIKPLGWFHSGVSGMALSGVVLDASGWGKMKAALRKPKPEWREGMHLRAKRENEGEEWYKPPKTKTYSYDLRVYTKEKQSKMPIEYEMLAPRGF